MLPLRDANPTRRVPVVTITFVVLNTLVFLGELYLNSQGELNNFILTWSVVPAELVGNPFAEWPTVFSAMFMHGGWAHLLGNMLYLWVFGDNVEDTLGHVWFVLFYLLSGIGATVAQVAISPQSQVPNLGASGAVAGVLGGYLLLFPRAEVTTLVFRFVTRIPAVVVLGFWFVYQFLFGVASLTNVQTQVGGGIAFFAHIGGFVVGIVLIFLFRLVLPSQSPARGRSDHWE